MPDYGITLLGLAGATFLIRLGGFWLGNQLPASGPWARGLRALPGCLIMALVTVLLLQAGPAEWAAATIAAVVVQLTRSLPLTMAAGIAAVLIMRAAI